MPQPEVDDSTARYWTLVEVLAWAITRDRAAIKTARTRSAVALGVMSAIAQTDAREDPVRRNLLLSPDKAENRLIRAAQVGRVVPEGINEETQVREAIPRKEWKSMRVRERDGRSALFHSGRSEERWRDVLYRVSEVLLIFPPFPNMAPTPPAEMPMPVAAVDAGAAADDIPAPPLPEPGPAEISAILATVVLPGNKATAGDITRWLRQTARYLLDRRISRPRIHAWLFEFELTRTPADQKESARRKRANQRVKHAIDWAESGIKS
jgi:hypothetical protein